MNARDLALRNEQLFEEECYDAGYDSVENGPNIENCHFKFFATTTKTAAWERGAHDARTAAEKGQ